MSAGVVAALVAEARTLEASVRRGDGLFERVDGTLVAISGMGAVAAAAAAERLIAAGADALVSWGMAGGLAPSLTAGTLCLPVRVHARDGVGYDTTRSWRERLAVSVPPRETIVAGTLLSSHEAIEDVRAKDAAYRETDALAVDMESVAIAGVAARRGLAFVAVRVIVDTARDTLPAAVMAASRDGQVHMGRLVRGLSRSPAQIVPLMRLGRRYRAAIRVLNLVARSGALAWRESSASTAGPV